MSNRAIDFQLYNRAGGIINKTGGFVQVCAAGTPDKVTLYKLDGTSQTNPGSLTYGAFYAEFDKSNSSVDLYILSPTGHMRVVKGYVPGSQPAIHIDAAVFSTTLVIPYSIVDSTANVEKDTGFDLPLDALVQPSGIAIDNTVADSGQTIIAGILSSESGGDADGFIVAASTAAVATVPAVDAITVGGSETYLSSTTLGALVNDFLAGSNSAGDVGTGNHKPYRVGATAKSISYTLNTGTDTAKGFLIIPLELGATIATAS